MGLGHAPIACLSLPQFVQRGFLGAALALGLALTFGLGLGGPGRLLTLNPRRAATAVGPV